MPRIMGKLIAFIASVVLLLAGIACNVPMKVPMKVLPITEIELKTEPDTKGIQPGMTTRAEIFRRFADFDTGWKGERLFLGRWLYSGSGNSWGRRWAGKVLVVEFDSKDVVARYEVLSDKEFLHIEDSWLTLTKDQPEACQRSDNEEPAKIVNVAGKDLISLAQGPCQYRIAAGQIEGFSVNTYASVYSPGVKRAARDFGLIIHLKEGIQASCSVGKNRHGIKRIDLETDVPTVVQLLRFRRVSD